MLYFSPKKGFQSWKRVCLGDDKLHYLCVVFVRVRECVCVCTQPLPCLNVCSMVIWRAASGRQSDGEQMKCEHSHSLSLCHLISFFISLLLLHTVSRLLSDCLSLLQCLCPVSLLCVICPHQSQLSALCFFFSTL